MKIQIDLDEITQQLDELYDQRARLKFELKNVEKEKNTQRNPISFNELTGATNEKTTKSTAKAPVKSTELKAEKKAPEME